MLSQEYVDLRDFLYNIEKHIKECCNVSKSYEDVIVRNRVKELLEHIEIVGDVIEGQVEFNLEMINKRAADSF